MNINHYSSLVLIAGLSVTSVQAAIVFYDDMESYTVGTDVDVSEGDKLYLNINIQNQDFATPFGSPNQFAFLDGGSEFSRVNSTSELMTYSFDMLEPITAQTGITRFGLGQGDVNSNAYAAWSINDGSLATLDNTSLVSGALPTLEQNRHYVTYIVHNGSASSQTITGSGDSLAAGETALFFYDTVTSSLIDAGRYTHTGSKTASSFLVRSFTADDNTLYYDNITQQDVLDVSIPEPSAYATIFGAITLGLLLRRYSRRS